MAPSRRKSKAYSAAAAADACRQWKVGDLVLAKVKGFPAWPATVSQPEKWGYSVDLKKVLVHFFGTKQIAFCSPADVVAFTEEKKVSLLGKRHGKGADFVRAVQEITQCFENKQNKDIVDDFHNTDEVICRTNTGNSIDSLSTSKPRDQTKKKTSSGTLISHLNSSRDRNEESSPNKEGVTNILFDKDSISEEPTDNNVVFGDTIFATNCSSRKRSFKPKRDLRSRKSSSSQNLMPSNDGTKCFTNIAFNICRERSLTRNKQIKKTLDTSDMNGTDSPAHVSNGSIEDNGSEIVTLDSDTLSFNDGSTLEVGSNHEHIDTVECLEEEVELAKKGFDFQTKAIDFKKKKNSKRKRSSDDTSENTFATLDKVADVEEEKPKIKQDLPNKELDQGFSKENGDEHLPLVKRARVRMGKQTSVTENLDSSIKMEDNSSKQGVGDITAKKNSFMLKVDIDIDNLSPGNNYFQTPEIKHHSPENKKYQILSPLDNEAVLPLSKRLHRALEAMSANAAEESLACAETLLVNGHCISPIQTRLNPPLDDKIENNLDVQRVMSHVSPIISEENKSSVDAVNWTQPVISCKEIEIVEEFTQASSTDNIMPDIDIESCSPRINQDSMNRPSPKNLKQYEDTRSSDNRTKIPVKEDDTSTGIVTAPALEADTVSNFSSKNIETLHLNNKVCTFYDNESLKILPDDKNQVDSICEDVKEIDQKSFINTEAVSTAIWRLKDTKHLSHSASISSGIFGDKDANGIHLRPSPANGALFPPRDSPSYTSLYRSKKLGHTNFLQNNGCGSPAVHLNDHCKDVDERKSDSAVGKNHITDAGTYLTSFKSMLGALTRTKESIGRATCMAIDCIKYGTVNKVVDIIVRYMENEQSLHKRVDLFFLVDSLTQCSRDLKGDIRDIFPSEIQTVLPRLVAAAGPPGNTARENRRQCLKVLKLWLERSTFPESVLQHHIRHLNSLSYSSSNVGSSRTSRNERAIDDPIREMEGMLVDEYGSNSSFQLPDFCMPSMLKVEEDDKSDSDGANFEAVTPEHNSATPKEQDPAPALEKHRHILEDVDGELEMEDVSPTCEAKVPISLAPPMPVDMPLSSSPPLPTSPPPPPPPPPPCLPPPTLHHTNNMQDNLQAVAHHEVVVKPKAMISDTVNYQTQDHRNFQTETRLHDSFASSSFNSGAVSHGPVGPMKRQLHESPTECSFGNVPVGPSSNTILHTQNYHTDTQLNESNGTCSYGNVHISHVTMGPTSNNGRQTNGELLHNKAYHLPPPPPVQSSQFSYAHDDSHREQPWRDRHPQPWRDRDAPLPPYYNRYHYPTNTDDGSYYTDHDRSYPRREFNDRWRSPGPSFSGPYHPHDRDRVPYPPGPYFQDERTSRRNQGRSYHHPSRDMNYRNSIPVRPYDAPRYWRPR